jgi:Protein of unknown function (DUF2970)
MPGVDRGEKGTVPAVEVKASLWHIVKTVVLAFFGVRKSMQHERETVHLSPVQIVVAGLLGAVVFVMSLVLLVRFIIGRATG